MSRKIKAGDEVRSLVDKPAGPFGKPIPAGTVGYVADATGDVITVDVERDGEPDHFVAKPSEVELVK